MRRILDEATVRRIVRESVVRRMLFEAEGDSPPPTIPGIADLLGGLPDNAGAGAATVAGPTMADIKRSSAPGADPSKKFKPKSGESALDAIMRLARGKETAKAEIDPATGDEVFGVETGRAVIDMIQRATSNGVNSDFNPSVPEKVMEQWQAEAEGIAPLPIMNSEGSNVDQISFTPDEAGLVAYLVGIQLALFGKMVSRAEYEEGKGLIAELQDTRDKLADIHGFGLSLGFTQMYTTDNELRDTARILKSFIENQDTDPSLQKTKALLAYFASENTTASEGFTSAGIVALGLAAVVAVVAAAYLTGGLAAGALGFGEGAGLAVGTAAAASGVAGATAAAATIAAASEAGIAAGITGWLYIIPVTKTALTFLAGKGLIAASSAGIAGIIGGIYGAGWCGNTLDDYSDDYLEFKAALTSRDTVGGMGELRGEIEDVDDYGSSETGNIKRALINALEKIEMSNASSNIRSKVLADLKAAEGGSGAVVGGR